jgi:hypothetical protein
MKVYQAIAEVAAELAARGISKDSRNQAQGFNFRGIDAVYNALAPLLAKHKLCILPRCISRECVERTNSKGNALFYVTVQAEFDLVSAEDGSKHTVSTFGEAMDSGDKATNKAMSAAYKYAAFQAFCIPTEETSVDSDAETHEVRAQPDSVGLANAVNAIRGATTVNDIGKHLKAGVALYPNSKEALQKHASERKAQLTQQLAEQA